MRRKKGFKTKLEGQSASYQRAIIVAFFTDICALIYHIAISVVFYFLGITPMVYYNIFSVSLFLSMAFIIPRLKNYFVPYNLVLIEVIVHQLLADYFLGSYCSFHSFILLMGILPFLVIEKKQKYTVCITLCSVFIYILLGSIEINPKYDVAQDVLFGIRVFNILITIFIIIFMMMIYTKIVVKIEKNLKEHGEALEKEIKMAAVIQQNFFKQQLYNIENYQVSYFSRPMAGVSGDVYDFYKTGTNLDGLGIFDVSGHGISSGLVTMLVKNVIHQEFYNQPDAELWEILNTINDRLIAEKGEIQNYLTGILVRLTPRKIEIVDAGHPAPILYKQSTGQCDFIKLDEKSAGAIGIAGFPVYYESLYYNFEKGDELVLFSDGVIDIKNPEEEYFGKQRLLDTIKAIAEKKPSEQIIILEKAIKEFCGGRKQTDDLTVIILKK
ncbi:MAG: serine/threonine-protein phosphatase [Treponema sp.]|nr:serine/threonine-protein phosphatase [Treponema sp.]